MCLLSIYLFLCPLKKGTKLPPQNYLVVVCSTLFFLEFVPSDSTKIWNSSQFCMGSEKPYREGKKKVGRTYNTEIILGRKFSTIFNATETDVILAEARRCFCVFWCLGGFRSAPEHEKYFLIVLLIFIIFLIFFNLFFLPRVPEALTQFGCGDCPRTQLISPG